MAAKDPVLPLAEEALYHARRGCALAGWVNDRTNITLLTVLTDAALVYNLAERERVVVTQIHYELTSVNDNGRVEFGWTDQPNGAGNFHPFTPLYRQSNGATLTGSVPDDKVLCPPAVLRYADGVRSITARVRTTNTVGTITVSWRGWAEHDDRG